MHILIETFQDVFKAGQLSTSQFHVVCQLRRSFNSDSQFKHNSALLRDSWKWQIFIEFTKQPWPRLASETDTSQMLSNSHERNLVDLIQVLNHDSVFHTPEIKSYSYETK